MSEKSHVGMGFYVCPVCGLNHGNVVLLSRHIGDAGKVLERNNFMGFALCQYHDAMKEEYLALVECKAQPEGTDSIKPEQAERTGQIAHVRRTALSRIFNGKQIPEDMEFVFVEEGVIARLQGLVKEGGQ